MTDDCTNVTGIVSAGPDMEGQVGRQHCMIHQVLNVAGSPRASADRVFSSLPTKYASPAVSASHPLQAIMRDAVTGALYAAGSHLTGWAANAAQFVTSPNKSLVGASWVDK